MAAVAQSMNVEPSKGEELYLGLDSSTQSLSATILDSSLRVIYQKSINYDSALPHFRTDHGMRRGPPGSHRVLAPPLMWVFFFEDSYCR